MDKERLHERDELKEKDLEINRLQKEIANLRSQKRIKSDPSPRQQPIDVSSKSKQIIQNEDLDTAGQEKIDDTNRSQTKVLLITAHRSGSTFLGELFNQNKNVFYLFEPLAAIQSKMSTTGCDENPEEKIR